MKKTDILFYQTNKKAVTLSHQCKTENGIEEDEIFTIDKVIRDFEQLLVVNQYLQFYTINPNQIVNEKK